MAMGHLKTGVTKAQAIGDINSIAADLAKTYPKDDAKTMFTLAQPSLYGDYVGRPIREFLTGLMLLSGLILLAACANLGSLFAARAADRSKEVALRLALGSSRKRILRALFTESILVSIAGGGVGLAGSVVVTARTICVASLPAVASAIECEPGCKSVCGGCTACIGERVPLRRRPGETGAAH